MKILLIEDNLVLARQVVEYLECQGCQLDHALKGRQGLELVLTHPYDLVIVDLMLPDIDGFSVCEKIKQDQAVNMPVLILTARDAIDDKTRGFSAGADDYLTKPFDLMELWLRCQALTRRQALFRSQKISIDELSLDLSTRSVQRQGQSLTLNQTSFLILATLAQAYPQPVSRSLLIHKIWQDEPPDSDALKSHIYQLRQILDKGFSYPMLKTINNLGYTLSIEKHAEK